MRRGYLVIGLGVRGSLFIRALQYLNPSAPIWIFDTVGSRIRDAAVTFGALPCSYDELATVALAVDMTIVASPVATHLEYATSLVPMSRRLLTEKPLLSTAAMAQPVMPDILKDYADRLWIGYSERVNPVAAGYREVIGTALAARTEGAMLTCHRVRATSSAVTALEEIAIHDLDLLIHRGAPAVEITAVTELHGRCEIVGMVKGACNFRIVGAMTADDWVTETAYFAPGRRALRGAVDPYGDSERLVGIAALLEAVHDGQRTGDLSDVELEMRLWATIAPFTERDARV